MRRRFAAFSSGQASALLGPGLLAVAALLLRSDLAARAGAAEALEAANASLRDADRRKDEFLAALAREEVSPLRILLVDDNADALSALAELLALRGHEVHTAADGPSGIDAAPGPLWRAP